MMRQYVISIFACFILDVEKSASLKHNLALLLSKDTENVTKYHIIDTASWTSWRNITRRMKNASMRGSTNGDSWPQWLVNNT